MPALVSVAADIDRASPSVRSILAAAGLREGFDWTWAREPEGWRLWVAQEAHAAVADALHPYRPALAALLAATPPAPGLSLAHRIALDSLQRAAAVQLGPVDLATPAVAKALLSCETDSTSYVNGAGDWKLKDDGTGEVLAVRLASTPPSWADGVPGVWYEGQAAVVSVERAPAMARQLATVAPSLACALLRALGLLPEPTVPEDTDLLASAVGYDDLPPDLVVSVERLARKLAWPEGLRLRPYQEIAVAFAVSVGGRALIGDSPGVGKTLVGIGLLKLDLAAHTPAMVIAPASALTNWRDEIRKWAPSLSPVIVDAKTVLTPSRGVVWILSWSRLHSLLPRMAALKIQTMIADEAHHAKTPDSQRGQAFSAFSRGIPRVLALTGTPVENRTGELFNLLHALRPDLYASRPVFLGRYGSAKKKVVNGRTFSDDRRDSLLPELRQNLRGIMVRRLKTDVLRDLPDKTRTAVWVDLPLAVRQAYEAAEANIDAIVADGIRKRRIEVAMQAVAAGSTFGEALNHANGLIMGSPSQLAALAIVVLGHMRRLVGRAKVPQVIGWLDEFLRAGEPIVVFHEHRDVSAEIGAALTKMHARWSYIDGTVAIEERGERVKAFQAGKFDVMLAGLRSANTAITLTRASHVLFAERALVPAIEEQAEDRLHRVSQRAAVNAWYIMARGTVDERLDVIANSKRASIGKLIGVETVGAETDDGQELSGPAVKSAAGIFAHRVEAAVRAWHGGADVVITDEALRLALAGKL
jgi:superfamily II DNA or RNA helicase